jgi:hypothetical protein
VDPVQTVHPSRVARHTIFTPEFEKVIEIIAIERVRLAMLARFGRRLLLPPAAGGDAADS